MSDDGTSCLRKEFPSLTGMAQRVSDPLLPPKTRKQFESESFSSISRPVSDPLPTPSPLKTLAFLILFFLIHLSLLALNLGSISFSGIDGLDEAALQKASGLSLNEAFDPTALPAAVARLTEYFQAQGRYFVLVKTPELIPLDETKLQLAFHLEEKLSSDKVKLNLQGMQYFSTAKLQQLLLITEEARPPLSSLPKTMQQIASLYHNRGYLFAKVKLDSLVLRDELNAYIGISEAKPLRIKEYVFRGNKITRDKTLLTLSGLQSQPVISPEVLSLAEENILQKSYIRSCLVEPINESSVLIKVEEGRMTFLEGVLGMNRLAGKLQLSGMLRLQFLNLWGSDRAIKLYWKRLPTSSSELSLSYHDPGFYSFPLAADLELKRSEQDSTWIASQAGLSVYYRMLRQNVGLELGTQSIRPGSRDPASVESENLNSLGAFWNFSRDEGGSNPYKGYSFDLRYRLNSSKKTSKLYGATEAKANLLVPFSGRWVSFLQLNLRNLENRNAPAWQQYKMGGYASLRGYNEDEFSSFRLAWINSELRYRLSPESRIYLLFDQGFWGRQDNTLKTDLFGVGLGMKVKTRLGILGLEYALGYRDNSLASFNLGMIHAGLDLGF